MKNKKIKISLLMSLLMIVMLFFFVGVLCLSGAHSRVSRLNGGENLGGQLGQTIDAEFRIKNKPNDTVGKELVFSLKEGDTYLDIPSVTKLDTIDDYLKANGYAGKTVKLDFDNMYCDLLSGDVVVGQPVESTYSPLKLYSCNYVLDGELEIRGRISSRSYMIVGCEVTLNATIVNNVEYVTTNSYESISIESGGTLNMKGTLSGAQSIRVQGNDEKNRAILNIYPEANFAQVTLNNCTTDIDYKQQYDGEMYPRPIHYAPNDGSRIYDYGYSLTEGKTPITLVHEFVRKVFNDEYIPHLSSPASGMPILYAGKDITDLETRLTGDPSTSAYLYKYSYNIEKGEAVASPKLIEYTAKLVYSHEGVFQVRNNESENLQYQDETGAVLTAEQIKEFKLPIFYGAPVLDVEWYFNKITLPTIRRADSIFLGASYDKKTEAGGGTETLTVLDRTYSTSRDDNVLTLNFMATKYNFSIELTSKWSDGARENTRVLRDSDDAEQRSLMQSMTLEDIISKIDDIRLQSDGSYLDCTISMDIKEAPGNETGFWTDPGKPLLFNNGAYTLLMPDTYAITEGVNEEDIKCLTSFPDGTVLHVGSGAAVTLGRNFHVSTPRIYNEEKSLHAIQVDEGGKLIISKQDNKENQVYIGYKGAKVDYYTLPILNHGIVELQGDTYMGIPSSGYTISNYGKIVVKATGIFDSSSEATGFRSIEQMSATASLVIDSAEEINGKIYLKPFALNQNDIVATNTNKNNSKLIEIPSHLLKVTLNESGEYVLALYGADDKQYMDKYGVVLDGKKFSLIRYFKTAGDTSEKEDSDDKTTYDTFGAALNKITELSGSTNRNKEIIIQYASASINQLTLNEHLILNDSFTFSSLNTATNANNELVLQFNRSNDTSNKAFVINKPFISNLSLRFIARASMQINADFTFITDDKKIYQEGSRETEALIHITKGTTNISSQIEVNPIITAVGDGIVVDSGATLTITATDAKYTDIIVSQGIPLITSGAVSLFGGVSGIYKDHRSQVLGSAPIQILDGGSLTANKINFIMSEGHDSLFTVGGTLTLADEIVTSAVKYFADVQNNGKIIFSDKFNYVKTPIKISATTYSHPVIEYKTSSKPTFFRSMYVVNTAVFKDKSIIMYTGESIDNKTLPSLVKWMQEIQVIDENGSKIENNQLSFDYSNNSCVLGREFSITYAQGFDSTGSPTTRYNGGDVYNFAEIKQDGYLYGGMQYTSNGKTFYTKTIPSYMDGDWTDVQPCLFEYGDVLRFEITYNGYARDYDYNNVIKPHTVSIAGIDGTIFPEFTSKSNSTKAIMDWIDGIRKKADATYIDCEISIKFATGNNNIKNATMYINDAFVFAHGKYTLKNPTAATNVTETDLPKIAPFRKATSVNTDYAGEILIVKDGATLIVDSPFSFQASAWGNKPIITVELGGTLTIQCKKEGGSYYTGGILGANGRDSTYELVLNKGTINYNIIADNAFIWGDDNSYALRNFGTLNISGASYNFSKAFKGTIVVENTSVINLSGSGIASLYLRINADPALLGDRVIFTCSDDIAASIKISLSFTNGSSDYTVSMSKIDGVNVGKIIYDKQYEDVFIIYGENNSYTLARKYTRISNTGMTYYEDVLTNATIADVLTYIKEIKSGAPTLNFGNGADVFSYSVTNGTITIDFDCEITGNPFFLGASGITAPVIKIGSGVTVTSYANIQFGIGTGKADPTVGELNSCGYMQNNGTFVVMRGIFQTGAIKGSKFIMASPDVLLIKNSGTITINYAENEYAYLQFYGFIEHAALTAKIHIENQGKYNGNGTTNLYPIKVLLPYGTTVKNIKPFTLGDDIQQFPFNTNFGDYNKIYLATVETAKVYFPNLIAEKVTLTDDGTIIAGKTIGYTTQYKLGDTISEISTSQDFMIGESKYFNVPEFKENGIDIYGYLGMEIDGKFYKSFQSTPIGFAPTADFVVTFVYEKVTLHNQFKLEQSSEGGIEFHAYVTYGSNKSGYVLVVQSATFKDAFDQLNNLILKDTTIPLKLIFNDYTSDIDLDLTESINKKISLLRSISGNVTIHYPLYDTYDNDGLPSPIKITLASSFTGNTLVYKGTTDIDSTKYVFNLGDSQAAAVVDGNIVLGTWTADYASYQITKPSAGFAYAVKETFSLDSSTTRYRVIANTTTMNLALSAIKDLNTANNSGEKHTIDFVDVNSFILENDVAIEFHHNSVLKGKIRAGVHGFVIPENAEVVFDSLVLSSKVDVKAGATLTLSGTTVFSTEMEHVKYRRFCISGKGAKVIDLNLVTSKISVAVDCDLDIGDMFIQTDDKTKFALAKSEITDEAVKLNNLKTGVYQDTATKGYYIGLKVPSLRLFTTAGITDHGEVAFDGVWSITANPRIDDVATSKLPTLTYSWRYTSYNGGSDTLNITTATLTNKDVALVAGISYSFFCTVSYTYEGTTSTSNEARYTLTATKNIITITQPQHGNANNLKYGDSLEGISLTSDDSPTYGLYTFAAGQSLKAGTHSYNWIFTPSAEALESYDFENKTGTIELTVAKYDITIIWDTKDNFTYNGTDQSRGIFAYYIAVNSTDKVALKVEIIGEFRNVNTDGYTFTAKFKTDSESENYNITAGETSVYHIKPKSITLKANDITLSYGSAVPTYSINFGEDTLAKNDITYTQGNFSCTYTNTSTFGEYSISIINLSHANYTITTDNTAVVQVAKIKATVQVDNATRKYNEDNPTFTITTTGFRASDNITFLATTTAGKASPVGEYFITITEQDLIAYEIEYFNGTLTITKAEYSNISHGNLSGTYDPTMNLSNYTLFTGYSWEDDTIIPTVTNNTFTVFYNMDEDNYESFRLEITITIKRASVSVPTITDKTFNGEKQNAGIAPNPGYDITDEGGIEADEYTAVLSLDGNYMWEDGSTGNKTLSYKILPTKSFTDFVNEFKNAIALAPDNLTYEQVNADIHKMAEKYSELDGNTLAQFQKQDIDNISALLAKAAKINEAKLAAETAIDALKGASVETIRAEGIDKLREKNEAATQAIAIFTALSGGLKEEDLSGYEVNFLPVPALLKSYSDNYNLALTALGDLANFKAEDLLTSNGDDRKIWQGKLETAKATVAEFIAVGGTTENLDGHFHIARVASELDAFDIYLEFWGKNKQTWELDTDNLTLTSVALLQELDSAYAELKTNARAVSLLTAEEVASIIRVTQLGKDINEAKLAAETAIDALKGASVETIRAEGIDKLREKNEAATQAIAIFTALSGGLKEKDLSGYEVNFLPVPDLLKSYSDNYNLALTALGDLANFKAEDLLTSNGDDRKIWQGKLETAKATVAEFIAVGGTTENLDGHFHIARVASELDAFDIYLEFWGKNKQTWELDTDNLTLTSVALLQELDSAYAELKTNARAVSLLTAEEVASIIRVTQLGKDINEAKLAAEDALKLLVGANADTIRTDGKEAFVAKLSTAKTAIEQYVALAKGNLKTTDLTNHAAYDTANDILNKYTSTLSDANNALKDLEDKTAAGLVAKKFTRDAIMSLLDSAVDKIAAFVVAGGAEDSLDLVGFDEIARVKAAVTTFDSYIVFTGAHETTWQIPPRGLSWEDEDKVTALQTNYTALVAEIKALLNKDEKAAIESVIATFKQISGYKDEADKALGKINGITAEGLRSGALELGKTETDINAAKTAAKAYIDSSDGVSTADLKDYGNIAESEQSVADYKAYKAFADTHGSIYAKDPTLLSYPDALKVAEMHAAYLSLTEGEESILTSVEIAHIALLKGKADALIGKKDTADSTLTALKDAVTSGEDKQTLLDLLAKAITSTENFFTENGTYEDLTEYSAIQDSREKISEYEKQEFENQVENDLGAIEDFTPDVVGGMDIPNLENTIDKIQDAIDKIDTSSEITSDELADEREKLLEVKDNLIQKLSLEKTKIAAIDDLKAERDKLLAASAYSSSAKNEIAEYYQNAIDQITLATSATEITENKVICIQKMSSVEILHVGLLVSNIALALMLIGEILFIIHRKRLMKKKKVAKTYSSVLPIMLLATIGSGFIVGVTLLVSLILAVVAIGIYIARQMLHEFKARTAISPTLSVSDTTTTMSDAVAQESLESRVETATDTVAPHRTQLVQHSESSTLEDNEEETATDDNELEVFKGIEAHTGLAILVRYKKSFLAKLIQSPDDTKQTYSELKNALLSYKKVTNRVSWSYDSINLGRTKLAKFSIRGESLQLYLALNPDDYANTKYKVERTDAKKYEGTPCLYKIKNERRAKYAFDLIAKLGEGFELTAVAPQSIDYKAQVPYETTDALIERKLIKELITKENYDTFLKRKNMQVINKAKREFISAHEVSAILSDEVAASLVEQRTSGHGAKRKREKCIRGIVNIDRISQEFASGDKVTLITLQDKGLLSKSVNHYKILARGMLSKPLSVEANEYSLEAVKMILLTGGNVIKIKDERTI